MKLNTFLLIVLSVLVIASFAKRDKGTELKTILLDQSNNLFDKLNNFFTENQKVDDLNLSVKFSKKERAAIKDNLFRSYKEKFPAELESSINDSNKEKDIKSELFETVSDYIGVYSEMKAEIRPLLQLDKRAINLKENIQNSTGRLFDLQTESKEKETEDATESEKAGTSNETPKKENGLKKRKVEDKKVDNATFIKKYLEGDKKFNYITDYPDFSISEELFGKNILNQGNRGVCYSASVSMMYSIAINTILSRNKQKLLTSPLDTSTIALCSTYKNTFEKTSEEKKDLKNFNSLILFKDYNFNSADGGGMQGSTAVWVKHHLNMLFENSNISDRQIESAVPKHKLTLGLFGGPEYSNLCKARISEMKKKIDIFNKFLSKGEGVMDQLNKIKVINPRKRITNAASIKKLLIENGPFVFTIEVSSKGEKILYGLRGEALIHKEACNGNFFQSLSSGLHAILAVGVVKRGEKEFLKFKNTWDDSWGDKGYAYLELTESGSTCNFIKHSTTVVGSVALELPK